MSIFSRRERQTAPILADDIATHLEAYGQDEFGLVERPTIDTLFDSPVSRAVAVLARLQRLQSAEARRAAVELRDAAFSRGGWAIYGASYAIPAFLPSQTDSDVARELDVAKIDFLRQLALPDLRSHLSISDIVLWRQLYPRELE